MAYATKTTVSVERSKAEIERLVQQYGAQGFASGWSADGRAMIEFMYDGRRLRFVLNSPNPNDEQFTARMYRGQKAGKRPEAEAHKLWEQACRARWRALLLCIKAKLEAVESGITTFDTEFMPYVVLPNNRTVADHVSPMIEDAYKSGNVPKMLMFSGDK